MTARRRRAPPPGEFDIIARLFAPLATHPGAFGLADDLAWLKPRAGHHLVLKADAVVVGTHTLADDSPGDIARKALRVNLSDLAAKGARPLGYLLTLALPATVEFRWLAAFAAGLARDQAEFGLPLLGGDTTRTGGPAVVAITALGEVARRRPLLRGGARAGDLVFVTGTIGDSALGLGALQGKFPALAARHRRFLVRRYRLPEPRLALGRAVAPLATAAMDISDGLVADLGHICVASGCGADIDLPLVPASAAARACGDAQAVARVTGGDDYEILLTAPPAAERRLRAAGRRLGVPVAAIGRIVRGAGVRLFDAAGAEIAPARGGWTHF